jgi:hypothetical protein
MGTEPAEDKVRRGKDGEGELRYEMQWGRS